MHVITLTYPKWPINSTSNRVPSTKTISSSQQGTYILA